MKELFTALSKFQGDVIDATKDKSGYNYKYADLSQILQIARPVMSKYGLSVMQFPKNGSEGFIGIRTILAHESGEYLEDFYEIPVGLGNQKMSMPQNYGSTITYIRRFALASVLGITQDDNDAATQISKKDYMKSATSGKPTSDQWERLKAITPKENQAQARDWFDNQTKKGIEDYLLSQGGNNEA